jgi:hypothetical protein
MGGGQVLSFALLPPSAAAIIRLTLDTLKPVGGGHVGGGQVLSFALLPPSAAAIIRLTRDTLKPTCRAIALIVNPPSR